MPDPGGKAASGVYQRIINQVPPHSTYIEAFLGDGAILRKKKPALRIIGIEIALSVVWNSLHTSSQSAF